MEYNWVYTDHTNDIGDWCPWSGSPVESGVIDESDPDADADHAGCPAGCASSEIERDD